MTPESLYQLLPAIYRIRDIERGRPLEALMKVIGEQASYVHADIDDLYDNWFIETCDDWVVPYLGELVGIRKGAPMGEPGDTAANSSPGSLKTLYPRREVSRLVDARRRKGTLKVFEDLARFVAGWRARIVENRVDQAVSVIAGKTVARDGIVSARVGTVPRTSGQSTKPLYRRSLKVNSSLTDIHRVGSSTSNITLRVWRRFAQTLTRTEPAPIVDPQMAWKDDNQNMWDVYTFSPFGFDTPLMVHDQFTSAVEAARQQDPFPPKSCCEESGPSQSKDLIPPTLIDPFKQTRFISSDLLRDDFPTATQSRKSLFYGDYRSFAVTGFAVEKVGVADLSSESNFLTSATIDKEVFVDPKLGRLAFRHGTKKPVTYHFATSSMMGGGEYSRTTARHSLYPVHRFAPDSRAFPRTSQLDSFFAANIEVTPSNANISQSVGFEFTGSTIYRCQNKVLRIRRHQILELRASNKSFPIIRFVDEHDKLQAITIEMEVGSQLSIDGLAIWAESIEIKYVASETTTSEELKFQSDQSPCGCDQGKRNERASTPPLVSLRHSTIVPRSKRFGDNRKNGLLKLCIPGGKFIAKHAVLAEIQVDNTCGAHDCPRSPVEIHLEDSIVERSIDGKSEHAYAALSCARSTIMGTTRIHRIDAADDMIFRGTVCVSRRQFGSIRFSYVRPNPYLPRRYKCVPDANWSLTPDFVGQQFGSYGFAQLTVHCGVEIRKGAESGSEMGAFHNLFEAQRRDRLESQLDDFTPVNMTSTITFADESPP
jgi:hypothetical protein